jgi:hypothetical protein
MKNCVPAFPFWKTTNFPPFFHHKELVMKNALITLLLVLGFTGTSLGALLIDVTANDNSKYVELSPGDSTYIYVKVWAAVSGTDGNIQDDGLSALFLNVIVSKPSSMGGINGINKDTREAGFTGTHDSDNFVDIDGDGTLDWGAPSGTVNTSVGQIFSTDFPDPIYADFPNVVTMTKNGMIYYYIDRLRVKFTGLTGSGDTMVNAQSPLWTSSNPKAIWYEDSSEYWDSGSSYDEREHSDYGSMQEHKKYITGTTTPSNFAVGDPVILHLVPEPSTFALLGIGALGLLVYAGRRRR